MREKKIHVWKDFFFVILETIYRNQKFLKIKLTKYQYYRFLNIINYYILFTKINLFFNIYKKFKLINSLLKDFKHHMIITKNLILNLVNTKIK